jgi:hypothetical protein
MAKKKEKHKLTKEVAKFCCKLIGCSGLRKECLCGDVSCEIIHKIMFNTK